MAHLTTEELLVAWEAAERTAWDSGRASPAAPLEKGMPAKGSPSIQEHLQACADCRLRVSEVGAVLEEAAVALLDERPDCLEPDELAELSAEERRGHPHLRDCPLCREELRALSDLEGRRRMEAILERAADWLRPRALVPDARRAAVYAGSSGGPSLELKSGAHWEGELAGARIAARVDRETLAIEVTGDSNRPLELILEDEMLEERRRLATGRTTLDVGAWQRARLVAVKGDRTSG